MNVHEALFQQHVVLFSGRPITKGELREALAVLPEVQSMKGRPLAQLSLGVASVDHLVETIHVLADAAERDQFDASDDSLLVWPNAGKPNNVGRFLELTFGSRSHPFDLQDCAILKAAMVRLLSCAPRVQSVTFGMEVGHNAALAILEAVCDACAAAVKIAFQPGNRSNVLAGLEDVCQKVHESTASAVCGAKSRPKQNGLRHCSRESMRPAELKSRWSTQIAEVEKTGTMEMPELMHWLADIGQFTSKLSILSSSSEVRDFVGSTLASALGVALRSPLGMQTLALPTFAKLCEMGEILHACSSDNLEMLDRLLSTLDDEVVSFALATGLPLACALANGAHSVTEELLLVWECDLALSPFGRPARLAAQCNSVAMLKLLAEHGVSMESGLEDDRKGVESPLLAALKNGNGAAVRHLVHTVGIDPSADLDLFIASDGNMASLRTAKQSPTSLLLAAASGRSMEVELLLALGADPGMCDQHPLLAAIRSGSRDTVALFLDKAACDALIDMPTLAADAIRAGMEQVLMSFAGRLKELDAAIATDLACLAVAFENGKVLEATLDVFYHNIAYKTLIAAARRSPKRATLLPIALGAARRFRVAGPATPPDPAPSLPTGGPVSSGTKRPAETPADEDNDHPSAAVCGEAGRHEQRIEGLEPARRRMRMLFAKNKIAREQAVAAEEEMERLLAALVAGDE